MALVGNKTDLIDQEDVKYEDAQAYAKVIILLKIIKFV
jgi:hypothetical protein